MTISDFLNISGGGQANIDPKISQDIYRALLDDFGVPEDTIEFLGAIKKEFCMFSETSLLIKFSKSSGKLGDCLKYISRMISRIPLKTGMDLGIQELDSGRPDGYYILFYILEESIRED